MYLREGLQNLFKGVFTELYEVSRRQDDIHKILRNNKRIGEKHAHS